MNNIKNLVFFRNEKIKWYFNYNNLYKLQLLLFNILRNNNQRNSNYNNN